LKNQAMRETREGMKTPRAIDGAVIAGLWRILAAISLLSRSGQFSKSILEYQKIKFLFLIKKFSLL